jgi:hypothetical protein
MEYRFSPLEESTEFLSVSPFLLPIINEQPSRIEQSLQIDDVKYQDDKTLLYFEVISDFPYDGHFQFNNLWLEDNAGNNLTSDSKGDSERIKQNTYVQKFKRKNKNEPLKMVTFKMPNLEVLKEMEIKIPLK